MDTHPLRIVSTVVVLANFAAGIVAGQVNPGAAQVKNPVASTAESVASGKQVYLRRCASCHAASGEGGPGNDLIPAAPSLVDAQWDHGSSDGEIFTVIKRGVPPTMMAGFDGGIPDQDIWNIVNYLRSLRAGR
jgi:mono/diheme cytochrome c family protein